MIGKINEVTDKKQLSPAWHVLHAYIYFAQEINHYKNTKRQCMSWMAGHDEPALIAAHAN